MARALLVAASLFLTGASPMSANASPVRRWVLSFPFEIRYRLAWDGGLVSAGLGDLEAVASPLVADLHPDTVELHMRVLHAFFPLGIVISSLLAGAALDAGVPWRACSCSAGTTQWATKGPGGSSSLFPTCLGTPRSGPLLRPWH